jgi:hypothetical protein
MSNYFIHFGCWNNGRCPSDSAFTKVSQQINDLSEKPEFISICGDNYYPIKVKDEKDNKKKFFTRKNLVSGFECLPKDIPIFMTYGNHDFENNLIDVTDESVIDETNIDKSVIDSGVYGELNNNCPITTTELDMKTHFPNIKLELFQSFLFKENTLLLFLDTTIYDKDDIEDYIGCYSRVNPELATIETVKNAQLEFVRSTIDTVSSNIKNIFIVGHHPIAQYKYKKEVRYLVLPDFANMIYDNIFSILKDKGLCHIKYYYLCADLHQYQTGTIVIKDEMIIKQYIVGTGGASMDAEIPIPEGLITKSDGGITYTINESIEENGFLKCAIDGEGEFNFEFIPVPEDVGSSSSVFDFIPTGTTETTGGKNKRTKRRTSRKNRKTRRQIKNKTRRQIKNKTKKIKN